MFAGIALENYTVTVMALIHMGNVVLVRIVESIFESVRCWGEAAVFLHLEVTRCFLDFGISWIYGFLDS